jgi:hypothetical protein
MTATLIEPAARPRPVVHRRGLLAGLLPRSAYLLTGFPLATVAFVLLVTGVALAAGTLVITVGVAVAALTLAIATGFARLERARVDAVLGRRLPRPAYRPLRPGLAGHVLSAGADPRRWLDLVHGIVAFPVATATFALTVGWWAGALGGVTYGLWEWALPRGDPDDTTLAELIGLGDTRTADILLTTGLGVVAWLTLPLVVAGCAAVQTGLARALLVGWED